MFSRWFCDMNIHRCFMLHVNSYYCTWMALSKAQQLVFMQISMEKWTKACLMYLHMISFYLTNAISVIDQNSRLTWNDFNITWGRNVYIKLLCSGNAKIWSFQEYRIIGCLSWVGHKKLNYLTFVYLQLLQNTGEILLWLSNAKDVSVSITFTGHIYIQMLMHFVWI